MQHVNLNDIRGLVGNVIGDHELVKQMHENSSLLGSVPELDSMAVVNLLLALENRYGFYVDDDEVDIDIFETLGSLKRFAESKLA